MSDIVVIVLDGAMISKTNSDIEELDETFQAEELNKVISNYNR